MINRNDVVGYSDAHTPLCNNLRMDCDRTEFRPIQAAPRALVMEQMNDARVRRHLPLATGTFDEAAYESFISGKQAMWSEHGYGPWAFFIGDRYAGWVVFSRMMAKRSLRWFCALGLLDMVD